MNRPRFWFLTALAIAAAASRVLPHPLNFTPLGAVALFGAATFPTRRAGAVMALVALLLSDCLLQLTYQAGWQPNWGFYRGQWVIYACLIPTILLGFAIRGRRAVPMVALASLGNALTFFLVTNFAVWANGSGVTYPRTWSGLMLCYEMAIPFFQRSLAGDLCYASILFGGLALAERGVPALRSRPANQQPATSPA